MSYSSQAALLTAAHRDEQARNAALIGILVARYFGIIIKPADLTGAIGAFLDAVITAIFSRRNRSIQIAQHYVLNYRAVELAALQAAGEIDGAWHLDGFTVPEPDPLELERLKASLIVTGPRAFVEKLERGIEPDVALAQAKTQVAGAAIRHTLNGGRDTIIAATLADQRAYGWARVLKSDHPCFFCEMLASRGPVYKDDSFDQSDPRWQGPGNVKVHDSCACGLELVYSRKAAWPGNAKELEELWQSQIANKFFGKDAINAWRRARDRYYREQAA